MLDEEAKVRGEIIEQLLSHAKKNKKMTKQHLSNFSRFVELYYHNIALDDLRAHSVLDLYGAALSHWTWFEKRKPNEVKLRIFNPNFEEDGWSSTHTIIELVQDDMPFLIDTLRMEINRLGYSVHLTVHVGGMQVRRGSKHELLEVLPLDTPCGTGIGEVPIHIEIDRRTDLDDLAELEANLLRVLTDVRTAVEDWDKMQAAVHVLVEQLSANENLHAEPSEIQETLSFLEHLVENYFTFLGCRDYRLVDRDGDKALEMIEDSGLGVLRDNGFGKRVRLFSEMPPPVRELAKSKHILLVAKSNTVSTVHRPTYTDYISVKLFDEQGEVVGERRFVGLFTSLAYHNNPDHIPILRLKTQAIMKRSGLSPSSHAYKELRNILEVFPRDDLFQGTEQELFEICMDILQMQERPQLRLFARKDLYGRFMSCLVYVPKEQYNAELRHHVMQVLKTSFNAEELSYSTLFSESLLARLHFMIRIDPHNPEPYDIKAIEARLIEACRLWVNDFHELLLEHFGEEKANALASKFDNSFPVNYREAFSPRTAIYDVQHMMALSDDQDMGLSLYNAIDEGERHLRFKLFCLQEMAPLSDVLPILENMGLRVIGEEPYGIVCRDNRSYWINDFSMLHKKNVDINVHELRDVFQDAFRHIWFGNAQNDGINYLVLSAKLTWRETSILRAYTKFLRQTGFTFSQLYIEETLAAHPEIARFLIQLFHCYFDPTLQDKPKREVKQLEDQLQTALDSVDILDQDRILRRFFHLLSATMRTNFYQLDKQGKPKCYLAFKFDSNRVPELPRPIPLYEIFVYSPRFEGVHLRAAKVARGGLRWSDRREDFRTEILGLMKAQQVKNAVIVPHGAKGGFVAKELPASGERDAVMEEVIGCYKNFIRGLLDLTDNIVDGMIQAPPAVVRYDDDDPYLVVAADKGTATFSDIANGISKEYGFWLGDAFASGGSTGYDHKKMGITARGAWESVKGNFRNLGIDIQRTDFTVIGIGDMAGDVFGNGMLLSEHIRLLAAFNHQHIFIDPNPDAASSFAERKRLFELPRSSWSDYNADLISQGGGVFNRFAKSLRLTPEIKARFGIEQDCLMPQELIKAILKAEVDLLWNGGIGTFVKAKSERHLDAGDRSNDAIRIDADELRCRVVGEGGNLALTQLARVEGALQGCLINTDFIDNSAGVDCSDHEVNIKILLNDIVANGDMTEKQRNDFLAEMSDEVAALVLADNYHQAMAINVSMHNPLATIDLYARYTDEQQRMGNLDRELEFLPNETVLKERKAAGKGFTRPEMCTLLAYSKNILNEDILASDIPEDPYFHDMLKCAFPAKLVKNHWPQIQHHSLRREIIASQLSNLICNSMGIPFIHRLRNETGAEVSSIIRAYSIARKVFDGPGLWSAIEALDDTVSAKTQVTLLLESFRLLQRVTRWFLKNMRRNLDITRNVEYFSSGVMKLTNLLPNILVGSDQEEAEAVYQGYLAEQVPQRLASRIASGNAMFSALDIIQAATRSGLNLKDLASVYFALGDLLELSWLRHLVRYHPIDNHWEGMARSALRDDLDQQQGDLAISVLKFGMKNDSVTETIEAWIEEHQNLVDRWRGMLTDLRASTPSFTIFLVAVRELMELTQHTINDEMGRPVHL